MKVNDGLWQIEINRETDVEATLKWTSVPFVRNSFFFIKEDCVNAILYFQGLG